jgi:hypothetical protein
MNEERAARYDEEIDPFLNEEEVRDFWMLMFSFHLRKTAAVELLRAFRVDSPRDLRKSQLANVTAEIRDSDEALVEWADAHERFLSAEANQLSSGPCSPEDLAAMEDYPRAETRLLEREWFGLEVFIRHFKFLRSEVQQYHHPQLNLDRLTDQRQELFYQLEEAVERHLLRKADDARVRLGLRVEPFPEDYEVRAMLETFGDQISNVKRPGEEKP